MRSGVTTMTRRTVASAGMGFSLAWFLGVLPRQDVAAREKNGYGSVKKAVKAQRDVCEISGGTLDVRTTPKGNAVTTCNGGGNGGNTCTTTKKWVHCYDTKDAPPQPPQQDVGGPPSDGVNEQPADDSPQAGGGGGVDPSGGNEQPTDPGTSGGGGHQAGGGGGINPSGGVESPSGGGVTLTAYDGGKDGQAKRHGTRHRQRHGKGRKK